MRPILSTALSVKKTDEFLESMVIASGPGLPGSWYSVIVVPYAGIAINPARKTSEISAKGFDTKRANLRVNSPLRSNAAIVKHIVKPAKANRGSKQTTEIELYRD